MTDVAGKKTGVWLIGACGGVATLTVIGARALARELKSAVGLLTETPLFDGLEMCAIDDLVFGGHEIRDTDYPSEALEFSERAGILDRSLLLALHDDLVEASAQVRPGYIVNPSPALKALAKHGRVARARSPKTIVEGIRKDIRAFQERHDLERVVVVNVSSTEPPRRLPIEFAHLERFRTMVESTRPRKALTSSVLYAYAALDLGCPVVNFTPSPGNTIPALVELAEERGVPHMGNDGKTGETLVKTVLAPLFSGRALRVRSWEGYNMLGNRDGLVLADPEARESKTRSKDQALRQLLDEDMHSKVTIDYVPSLDDWKVAWDFIHFEGFLGAKMSMQFTWQGNDSALAAPLVLDLARLAAYGHAQGESGLMTHAAAYFKSPAGADEQNFVKQLELLEAYVAHHRSDAGRTKARR
jgi:myo-inositol-1-phosphate synthase